MLSRMSENYIERIFDDNNIESAIKYLISKGDKSGSDGIKPSMLYEYCNDVIENTISEISSILEKVKGAKKIDSLFMYEARARQLYFHCLNQVMPDDGFEFVKRTRRPPQDALNAMISFGNTLLYTRFANEIYRSSLDIRFGIIHNSENRPESLNLDLADLFKPILVDRTIFTLVNKKMINEISDFEESENGGIYLSAKGKRIFLKEFEQKLETKIQYKGAKKSYSELISLEVKKLESYFRSGAKYKPFKYVN